MASSLLLRLFGPPRLFLYDDGTFSHGGMLRLADDQAPPDTLIKDSIKRVREQLAQVPEGKKAALVIAVDYKFGVIPASVRTGLAYRTESGWELHGEGFISKASKGVSVVAVKAW